MTQEVKRGEVNLEMNTTTVVTEENDNNSRDCTDNTGCGQGIGNIEEVNNLNKQSAYIKNIALNDLKMY